MKSKNLNSRCKGQTKTGESCRAAATSGGLRFFHANPNKAAELGRIGGRTKSRLPAEVSDPLPKLDNLSAVRDAVGKLIADVYEGKLHPRVAASLAPLFSLQFRSVEALEAMDLERRLQQVEKLFAKVEAEDALKGRGHDSV